MGYRHWMPVREANVAAVEINEPFIWIEFQVVVSINSISQPVHSGTLQGMSGRWRLLDAFIAKVAIKVISIIVNSFSRCLPIYCRDQSAGHFL